MCSDVATEFVGWRDCAHECMPDGQLGWRRKVAATKRSCGSDGADSDRRRIDVVAVIAHGLFGSGAELLVVRGFWNVAVAAHYFIAGLDADEPLGF